MPDKGPPMGGKVGPKKKYLYTYKWMPWHKSAHDKKSNGASKMENRGSRDPYPH